VSYELLPNSLKAKSRPRSAVNGIGGRQRTYGNIECDIKLNNSTWTHEVRPTVINGQQKLLLLGSFYGTFSFN
jgi:hypothetical protein